MRRHRTARERVAQNLLRSEVRPAGDTPVETLAWLLALYARYFAATFVVSGVVLGILCLVSFRSHPRTSPGPAGAQISTSDGSAAA
jgi:hypothetical protein